MSSIGLKRVTKDKHESAVDDRIETADTNTSKKSTKDVTEAFITSATKNNYKQASSRSPSSAAKYKLRPVLLPASQEKVILNTLKDKSVDIMKKSTAIHELLKSSEIDYVTISGLLFNDRLFKSGTISFVK